ncbi:MAG: hypothetical protein ACT4PL_11765 [Phycisphaerales bacterium]
MPQRTKPALASVAVGALVLILAAVAGRAGLIGGTGRTPTANGKSAGQPSDPQEPVPTTSAGQPTPKPNPASKPSAVSRVRIGAFNIEWLGKPEDRSGPAKGIAQTPEDLADLILKSGVCVLAVEEIVTRERGRPIRSRELEATIGLLNKAPGNDWAYVLFPGRNEGDQLTGVLWNSSRVSAIAPDGKKWEQASSEPHALPIEKGRGPQGSALWNRPPHAMKFSLGQGLTDFVVIVLHMKADYNGDFAAHRGMEATALVNALPGVRERFKDLDIVLLGDTNCTGEKEPALETFAKAGLADLNAKGLATHWRGGKMDRILSPSAQPEFAGAGFEVMSDAYLKSRGMNEKDYKQRFSDHYMVVSTVKVIEDDD